MNYNRLMTHFKAMLPADMQHPVVRTRPTTLGTALLAVVTWNSHKLRAFVIVSTVADIPAPMIADHLIFKLKGLTYARVPERHGAVGEQAHLALAKSIDGMPVRITILDAEDNPVQTVYLPGDSARRPTGD